MKVKYTSSRHCDYGNREISETVEEFVRARMNHDNLCRLIDRLCDNGTISAEDLGVFATWNEDYNIEFEQE